MSTDFAIAAARNNAAWCDAVCRAAGASPESTATLWRSRTSPPYFPNIITLEPGTPIAEVEAAVRTCSGSGDELGIKDSFHALDVSHLGFTKRFDARWIWRDPERPSQEAQQLRWNAVDSVEGLRAWEAAWWPETNSPAPRTRVFAASLLHAANITFLAGSRGAALVAGAAITETNGVVGLACCFLPSDEAAEVRRELLAEVSARFPNQSIAGYESGDELLAMKACGFRDVGPLAVWLGAPQLRSTPRT